MDKEKSRLTGSKVVIDLVGGIGNQLFIYFAGYHLANILNANLIIKSHSLHNSSENAVEIFNLPCHKMSKSRIFGSGLISKLRSVSTKMNLPPLFVGRNQVYRSSEIGFDPALELQTTPIHVKGYFQTHKYFNLYPNLNTEYFDGFKFSSRQVEEIAHDYKASSALMVHIRLGDYLKLENRYFGSLDTEYYKNAINKVKSLSNFSKIVVISDDIKLAKLHYFKIENLGLPVEWLDAPEIESSAELMMIMRNCKGFVIANSTFSWWIANLSSYPKVIAAPHPWFREAKTPDSLYPDSWIQVDSVWRDF
jgi:hypothetical protein